MQGMQQWFGRCHALHLLNDVSMVNDIFFIVSMIKTWHICGEAILHTKLNVLH